MRNLPGAVPMRAMSRCTWIVVAALLCAAAPSSLLAQGAGAVLSGRVTEAGDTVGLVGPEVEIVGTTLRRATNATGFFRFDALPPGSYELLVRRLGYQPTSVTVRLEEGRSVQQNIALRRLPNALTEVRIEGRMVHVPARFEEVYRRAARGVGKFFRREDIDRMNPSDIKSLLGTVPTVQVSDRGITFQRCQGGLSGLIVSAGGGRGGGTPQPAKVQVYIDGQRLSGSSGLDTSTQAIELNDIFRLVHPRDIEAMEVYTGVARIPAEFLNDACAVVAIWTKSY